MFAELEKIDPKNIKFTAFAMDENKVVKASGEASDLGSVAKLIRSLEDSQIFSEVKLISTTASTETEGRIIFSVSFNIQEDALKASANGAQTTPSPSPSATLQPIK